MADYGNRHNSTEKKGAGYFGELKRPAGDISTEISIGVEMDGKEVEIPSIVPTLSKSEIDHLLAGKAPTDEIVKKAYEHAQTRIKQGKTPFAQAGEIYKLPESGGLINMAKRPK
jgi:hypothetical protein